MFRKNRFHFKRTGIQSRWEEADRDPVLRLAKAYILAHLSDSELGIEPVAAHVNLGRSSFSKLFNEKLGISFPQYIASLRIEKAKELLKGTNLQISEIAFQVGFESVSHFNRTFKKALGITPRAFRNQ
jgi:AraC-like DNA-binding protein